MTENWDDLVAEGIRLRDAEELNNWEWGDLLLKVAPANPSNAGRPKSGAQAPNTLTRFAAAVDVPASTLKERRYVAERWPEAKRRYDVPWRAHKELASDPDRYRKIKTVKTKREAIVASGRNPVESLPTTIEGQAALIEKVAALPTGDKAFQKAIQRTPKTEVAISKAQDAVERDRSQQRSSNKKTTRPAAWREEQMRSLRGHLRNARRELEAANNIAAVLAPFSDAEGEEVAEYVSWVGQWLGGLDVTLRTGDMDAQLQKIVDGG